MSVPDSPDPASLASDPVTRSAPARVRYSRAEEVAWYATLATMFGAAAALFTNPAGRILLVKPNYRDHWSLPGGLLEQGEPPQAGCRREVAEELGLQITPGPLLTIDWVPPDGVRPRPIVHFIFDGGELDDDVPIELQDEELDEYRFVEPGDLASYLPPVIAARVTAALRSRVAGGAAYLPQAPGRSPGLGLLALRRPDLEVVEQRRGGGGNRVNREAERLGVMPGRRAEAADLADILQRGGADIVIGNPLGVGRAKGLNAPAHTSDGTLRARTAALPGPR
jgi:8-oxo-dGTP diphosphatase